MATDAPVHTVDAETTGRITHEARRVKAVCPYDDFRDVYVVTIEYVPDERCVEIKSLRAYLDSFAGREISHEALCEELYTTLAATLDPRELSVTLETNEYEGIVTTVRRTSTEAA